MAGSVLVTGAGGFVGPYVLDALAARGVPATAGCGTAEEEAPFARRGIPTLHFDVTDPEEVEAAVEKVRPSRVAHLAARSHVGASHRDLRGTHLVNFMGTVHVLESLARHSPGSRLLFVSSAAVYGQVPPGELPIREDAPLRPTDPYSASKLAAEVACQQVGRTGALEVVVVRAFNHTGPGQTDGFVCSSLARQVAAIRRGDRAPVLRVGDLSARRDFSDVRDVARAYVDLLLASGDGDVFNVCSGRSVAIGDVLRDLVRLAGVEVEIDQDPARLRPVDLPDLRGDGTRFRQRFGWSPEPIGDRTLDDLLDGWDRVDRE